MKYALILLILSACALQDLPFRQTELPERPELYTGTDGITTTIMPHPGHAYEEQPYNLVLFLHNKGAHSINGSEQGIYTLIHESQYIDVQNVQYAGEGTTSTYMLAGKTPANPYGAESRIHYLLRTKKLPAQTQQYTTDLIFQTCYPYQTTATIPVCIDTDVQGTQLNKICTAEEQTFTQGQGAPVAVTKVKPILIPEQEERGVQTPTGRPFVYDYITPVFEITLQNQGGGQVLKSGTARAFCQGTQEPRNMNLININARFQDQALDCQSPIRLNPGETTIKCRGTQRISVSSATFISHVQITARYDYSTTASTTLDIQHS